jgi:hypothetical protein
MHTENRCTKPALRSRRCINPEHLEIGSRGENLQDERDFSANGVDFNLL